MGGGAFCRGLGGGEFLAQPGHFGSGGGLVAKRVTESPAPEGPDDPSRCRRDQDQAHHASFRDRRPSLATIGSAKLSGSEPTGQR